MEFEIPISLQQIRTRFRSWSEDSSSKINPEQGYSSHFRK